MFAINLDIGDVIFENGGDIDLVVVRLLSVEHRAA